MHGVHGCVVDSTNIDRGIVSGDTHATSPKVRPRVRPKVRPRVRPKVRTRVKVWQIALMRAEPRVGGLPASLLVLAFWPGASTSSLASISRASATRTSPISSWT